MLTKMYFDDLADDLDSCICSQYAMNYDVPLSLRLGSVLSSKPTFQFSYISKAKRYVN